MNRAILSLPLLALLALSLAACSTDTIVATTNGDQPGGITVDGIGEVHVTPDTAYVTLGVQSRADTVAEAREQAAGRASRVIDVLRDHGLEDRDIQTSSILIVPRYDYSGREARLLGYEVTNMLAVTIRDIDSAGETLDAAVEAGGDDIRVHGIRFDVEDRDQALAQARERAMEDARSRAEQLAQHAGVSAGPAIAITETRSDPPQPVTFRAEAAFDAATTPIEAGTTAVKVEVRVIYAIN